MNLKFQVPVWPSYRESVENEFSTLPPEDREFHGQTTIIYLPTAVWRSLEEAFESIPSEKLTLGQFLSYLIIEKMAESS